MTRESSRLNHPSKPGVACEETKWFMETDGGLSSGEPMPHTSEPCGCRVSRLAGLHDGCSIHGRDPTIYHQVLRGHLTLPEAPQQSSHRHDILIASETEEEHDKDLRALIDYLHDKGHKLSYDKAQMSQPEVVGQKISQGKCEIRKTPEPQIVKELTGILGSMQLQQKLGGKLH